jgi:hypothetical protein
MAPSQDEEIIKANRLVYAYDKDCSKCPFADKILDKHGKVDCDYGDTGQGMPSSSFRGSPLYPHTFHGIGLDGLYGYPLGFYADNNESRNLPFGLFSLLGYNSIDDKIIKLAKDYKNCNKEDRDKVLESMLGKLDKLKEEHNDVFKQIEKYLLAYKNKYEDKRDDTGLLWELSSAWFGPRQLIR